MALYSIPPPTVYTETWDIAESLSSTSYSIYHSLDWLRVLFFGVIWIRISDQDLSGSWFIKGTDESTLAMDSSVPLVHHDQSDLGSLILIQITPKEHTLSSFSYPRNLKLISK